MDADDGCQNDRSEVSMWHNVDDTSLNVPFLSRNPRMAISKVLIPNYSEDPKDAKFHVWRLRRLGSSPVISRIGVFSERASGNAGSSASKLTIQSIFTDLSEKHGLNRVIVRASM
jgi:hypothetical protein